MLFFDRNHKMDDLIEANNIQLPQPAVKTKINPPRNNGSTRIQMGTPNNATQMVNNSQNNNMQRPLQQNTPQSTVNVVRPINTNNIINRDPNQNQPQQEQGLLPYVEQIVNEYMDVTDYETNQALFQLNEAEQNQLLVSLTNKLYGLIVDKVDEVDFGEIPNTRGNITKLSKYKQMIECLNVLERIFEQYKEKTEPIKVIRNAIDNIDNNADIFSQCFMGNISMGIVMYNTMTLSCVQAISYMIAVCIDYVKLPNKEGLSIVMDKTGVAKVKEHLLYENLVKFNDSCRQGDVENCLRPLIRARAKNFAAAAFLGIKAVLVIGAVVLALIPIMRDLVYFFFAMKQRISVYFDIQADLLEMNAQELKDNPNIKTDADKKTVIRRQLSIASGFRKIANTLQVSGKQAENQATKDIKQDRKDYKIDDVETDPTSSDGNNNSGGPLF